MNDLRFFLNSLLAELITKFFILPMIVVSANLLSTVDYNNAATIRVFVVTLATVSTQGIVLDVYRKLKVIDGKAIISISFGLIFLFQLILWGTCLIVLHVFNLIDSIYECLVLFVLHSIMIILMSIYRKLDGDFFRVLVFIFPVFPILYFLIKVFKLDGFVTSYALFTLLVSSVFFFSLKSRVCLVREGRESLITPVIVGFETWVSLLFVFSLPTLLSMLGGERHLGDILMFHAIVSIGVFFMFAVLNGYTVKFSKTEVERIDQEINKVWSYFFFLSIIAFLFVFYFKSWIFHFDYKMTVFLSFYFSMLLQVLNCMQGHYYRRNGFYKKSLLHNCILTILFFAFMFIFYDGDVEVYSNIFFWCNLIVFFYIFIEKKIIGESSSFHFLSMLMVVFCFIFSKNILFI